MLVCGFEDGLVLLDRKAVATGLNNRFERHDESAICAKARILTHNHAMRRLLIIGCGDVALRTIPMLKKKYRVYALVRDPAKRAELHALGVTPLLGDLDDRASLARIAGLADAVLHLAPPPNEGAGDPRTRNLLSVLSKGTGQRSSLPKRLIYISTSGVYGDCGGAWVSETHPLNSTSPRSRRRVDAEMQIRDWARRNQVNASILRVPGIYAADRLPLARIQQGTPGIAASEDSYTNHIHARRSGTHQRRGIALWKIMPRLSRQRRQSPEDGRIFRQRS